MIAPILTTNSIFILFLCSLGRSVWTNTLQAHWIWVWNKCWKYDLLRGSRGTISRDRSAIKHVSKWRRVTSGRALPCRAQGLRGGLHSHSPQFQTPIQHQAEGGEPCSKCGKYIQMHSLFFIIEFLLQYVNLCFLTGEHYVVVHLSSWLPESVARYHCQVFQYFEFPITIFGNTLLVA